MSGLCLWLKQVKFTSEANKRGIIIVIFEISWYAFVLSKITELFVIFLQIIKNNL